MIFGLITPYSIHFPSIRMSVPWQIQVIKRSALPAVTNDFRNSLIKAFVLYLKVTCERMQQLPTLLGAVVSSYILGWGGAARPVIP